MKYGIKKIYDLTIPDVIDCDEAIRVLSYLKHQFEQDRKHCLTATGMTQNLIMQYERKSHAVH